MLSALDETLLHQAAVPFAQTTVSDHRFFDRIWLGGHTRDMTLLLGLANYKNTNSCDGYFTLIKDGRQHNLRVARPLLPEPGVMGAGPIRVDIVEPLQALRFTIEAGQGYPLAGEFTFTGSVPASLEAAHRSRADGRIAQDYVRFDQLGRLNGWISLDGDLIPLDNWFGARDHSWGVRPGQGGYEPVTSLPRAGENPNDVGAGQIGLFVLALWFDLPSVAGYLMQMENGAGDVTYSHGRIIRRTGSGYSECETARIRHDLRFVPGTRKCLGGTVTVTTETGEEMTLEVEQLAASICYRGTGYDGGFNDGRGLGFHRGTVLESDVYDVSHAEDVVMPDGQVIRPWHRESGGIVRFAGEEGFAHFPALSSGPIQRYGLGLDG